MLRRQHLSLTGCTVGRMPSEAERCAVSCAPLAEAGCALCPFRWGQRVVQRQRGSSHDYSPDDGHAAVHPVREAPAVRQLRCHAVWLRRLHEFGTPLLGLPVGHGRMRLHRVSPVPLAAPTTVGATVTVAVGERPAVPAVCQVCVRCVPATVAQRARDGW